MDFKNCRNLTWFLKSLYTIVWYGEYGHLGVSLLPFRGAYALRGRVPSIKVVLVVKPKIRRSPFLATRILVTGVRAWEYGKYRQLEELPSSQAVAIHTYNMCNSVGHNMEPRYRCFENFLRHTNRKGHVWVGVGNRRSCLADGVDLNWLYCWSEVFLRCKGSY